MHASLRLACCSSWTLAFSGSLSARVTLLVLLLPAGDALAGLRLCFEDLQQQSLLGWFSVRPSKSETVSMRERAVCTNLYHHLGQPSCLLFASCSSNPVHAGSVCFDVQMFHVSPAAQCLHLNHVRTTVVSACQGHVSYQALTSVQPVVHILNDSQAPSEHVNLKTESGRSHRELSQSGMTFFPSSRSQASQSGTPTNPLVERSIEAQLHTIRQLSDDMMSQLDRATEACCSQ